MKVITTTKKLQRVFADWHRSHLDGNSMSSYELDKMLPREYGRLVVRQLIEDLELQ